MNALLFPSTSTFDSHPSSTSDARLSPPSAAVRRMGAQYSIPDSTTVSIFKEEDMNSVVSVFKEENRSSAASMSERNSSSEPSTEPATALGTIGKLIIELRTMIYDLLVPPPVAPEFSFIAGRYAKQARYSSTTALMACNSTLHAEIHPLLYKRREIAFVPRAASLGMLIDNIPIKASLDTIQSHLHKLNIDTVTLCLESSLLERHQRSRLVFLDGLVAALNQASSIKCLHIRFATKYDPFKNQPPRITHVIESYVSQLLKVEKLHHTLKIYVHDMLPQSVSDRNNCMSEVRRVVAFRLKESLKALNRNAEVTEPPNVRGLFQQVSIKEVHQLLHSVNRARVYDHLGAHDYEKKCWTNLCGNKPLMLKIARRHKV